LRSGGFLATYATSASSTGYDHDNRAGDLPSSCWVHKSCGSTSSKKAGRATMKESLGRGNILQIPFSPSRGDAASQHVTLCRILIIGRSGLHSSYEYS